VTTSGTAIGATSTRLTNLPVRLRPEMAASTNPTVVTSAGTTTAHSTVRPTTTPAPSADKAVRKWARPTKEPSTSVTLACRARSTGHITNAPTTSAAGSSIAAAVPAAG
jgi:hypothetical protein